ncbi:MAG: hypothetical protein ABI473_05990 [Candidatus Dormibacter sp.]
MIGPVGLALIVVLVLRLAKRHDGSGHSVHGEQANVRQAPAVVYVVVSLLIGAAVAFLSLEVYFGVVLAVAAGVLLFRHARRHRWFALGGFLLGMGACAAGFLSAALTNHDPAVTYDPSTIPFFWVGAVLAVCGAVTLVLASTGLLRRGSL